MYSHLFPAYWRLVNNKKVIYFDAACTYLKYQSTLDAISRYYTEYSCCSGDRESSVLGSQLLQEIQDTRKEVGQFLGAASGSSIIFTSWTTGWINTLFSSIDPSLIHTVIVSDIEHNSHFLAPLEWVNRYKKDFKMVSYKDVLIPSKLESIFSNVSSPFLFCITHASNITGVQFDIESLSKIVHKYGGYISVDDAQFIPHNQENVEKNEIDFLHFSAHKIGGPTWIWITYMSKQAIPLLVYSSRLWWGTVKKIEKFTPVYKELPYKFEGGVQDFAGILWLRSTIKQISSLGYNEIWNYTHSLTDYFWKLFYERWYETYFSLISEKNSSLISLSPKNFSVIDFHQFTNHFFEKAIVSFRTWTLCADNYVNTYLPNSNIMRISFWIYNTFTEIDVFFEALELFLESC